MKIYDIAIVGGGASAFFCAGFLQNKKVAILDNNPTPLRKLLISGGGKCNFTNLSLSANNYNGDRKFIKFVLDRYSNQDLIEFFDSYKLSYTIRNKTQLFCTHSAKDIYQILLSRSKKHSFYNFCEVFDIEKIDDNFYIFTSKGKIISKKVIIASGGISYKKIGASNIGYKIAEKFGHTISKLDPALVGFTLQPDQFWMKNLSGVSMKVKISVDGKTFYDDLLFAHKGISGPAVLNASVYWKKGSIKIDFAPKNTKLPRNFIKQVKNSHESLDIKKYTFAPAGNFGYEKAEVTRGGVDIDEINSETFESKKQKGLYFIAEVLDVTGELGGYNFQWAFSSGYCCALGLSQV